MQAGNTHLSIVNIIRKMRHNLVRLVGLRSKQFMQGVDPDDPLKLK